MSKISKRIIASVSSCLISASALLGFSSSAVDFSFGYTTTCVPVSSSTAFKKSQKAVSANQTRPHSEKGLPNAVLFFSWWLGLVGAYVFLALILYHISLLC